MPRAFPTDEYYDERRIGQHDGMELRDFFAAHVMAGLLAPNIPWDSETVPVYAEKAYEYADAMCKARNKRRAKV